VAVVALRGASEPLAKHSTVSTTGAVAKRQRACVGGRMLAERSLVVRRALVPVLTATGLSLAGCGPPIPQSLPVAPPTHARATPESQGAQLFIASGCGGCHTLSGVSGATGTAGPNLTNVALRPTLAGDTLPNTPETMTRWLLDPGALKPGATMPRVGLSQQQAQDLAAFLFAQPDSAP
jgi:cytochrome c